MCKIIIQNQNVNNYQLQAISEIIKFLNNTYREYFGDDVKEHKIIIDPSFNYPQCFRSDNTIHIATSISCYAQFAYQYCHELCHYMIPNDVPSQLRWLEETLCELSSLFFMPLIADDWITRGLPYKTEELLPYAERFNTYVINAIQCVIPFDLSELSDSTTVLSKILEKYCEIREINRYIALQLLPFFKKNPKSWSHIKYMCVIPTGLDLSDSLNEWIRSNTSETDVNFGISSIFMPKVSDTVL